ncbi:protoheme IX farnesyltransferase [Termitidicoccus mucosus]|uniref:Protoheme IX farnesyltransferase n=2 Tax=Termitidicoccus mucosus TaxID=1184151 RepID=A0A178IEV1_9BACT|nr:protoheme IX farnesyltransferase [Opitutaceae bacterium TSB47]
MRHTRAGFADYLELTKPRLSSLSVLTTVVGYFAARPVFDGALFFALLAGTAACAAGVAALNQWMEADTDALMRRTAARPIPGGKIATGTAFVIGWALCAAGLALLFARVTGGAAFFALATIVAYLALYTPAKRRSRFSTEIGAVAGAFPPLIGWAAVPGGDAALAWVLFAILFFWQIPHFMAIAWTHRRDYEAVNFPMLAVRDTTGGRVAAWSLACTFAVAAAGLAPAWLALAGHENARGHAGTSLAIIAAYAIVALALGAWFTKRALAFRRPPAGQTRETAARRLFFASIAWLPLQLAALVVLRLLA